MKVYWTQQAKKEWQRISLYCNLTFGKSVVLRFEAFTNRLNILLAENPYLGSKELLLEGRKKEYRSIVVHPHYKEIYYISKKRNTIYIVDLWDVRREPKALIKRIK